LIIYISDVFVEGVKRQSIFPVEFFITERAHIFSQRGVDVFEKTTRSWRSEMVNKCSESRGKFHFDLSSIVCFRAKKG